MGAPAERSCLSRDKNRQLCRARRPSLLAIAAINMIDIWAGFFLKLQANLITRWPLRNLGMNSNTEQESFSPNILPRDASKHGRIAELKTIQCYQSAHSIAGFGLLKYPAHISLVKSKSGTSLP
jgi:hypothetical protein